MELLPTWGRPWPLRPLSLQPHLVPPLPNTLRWASQAIGDAWNCQCPVQQHDLFILGTWQDCISGSSVLRFRHPGGTVSKRMNSSTIHSLWLISRVYFCRKEAAVLPVTATQSQLVLGKPVMLSPCQLFCLSPFLLHFTLGSSKGWMCFWMIRLWMCVFIVCASALFSFCSHVIQCNSGSGFIVW